MNASKLPNNPSEDVLAGDTVPDNYVDYTMRNSKPLPPITLQNFWTELNWLNISILSITPALTLYGLFTTKLIWKTTLFSVFYYFVTGLGMFAFMP